jgi:hypothetical protein
MKSDTLKNKSTIWQVSAQRRELRAEGENMNKPEVCLNPKPQTLNSELLSLNPKS